MTVSLADAATIFGSFVVGYLLMIVLAIFVGSVMVSAREASRMAPLLAMPAMLPLMLIGLLFSQPDGMIVKILSWFPLTSGSGIVTTVALGSEMSGLELVLSLGGAVLTGVVMLWVSARIFRATVLMAGQKFTAKHLASALRHADQVRGK